MNLGFFNWNTKRGRHEFRWWPAGLGVWLIGVGLCGCNQNASQVIVDHRTRVSRSDQLRVTTDYIFANDQFDNAEFEQKVSAGLNRWLSNPDIAATNVAWTKDPLVDSLPKEVEPEKTELDSLSFTVLDPHFVQGELWIKELVAEIADRPLPVSFWPPLYPKVNSAGGSTAWHAVLAGTYPELNGDQVDQLITACKLFDWTILNVQLDARLPWPNEAAVQAQTVVDNDSRWPPSAGVRGPGYNRFVWQTMLFGRGDALERGRVFAQLARHADIDVVLLAVQQDPNEAADEPFGYSIWLPAALIGGQLFLFDTELGLPLPSSNPQRFATLADVVHSPDLLKTLDLAVDESTSDQSNYRVRPSDIAHGIIALVDVPMESLTHRMAILERHLTGENRLSLTTHPSQIAEKLKDNSLIKAVKLSPLASLTIQFRNAIDDGEKLAEFNADIRDKLSWRVYEEEYVDSYVRLRTAKTKYFRNKLVSPRGIRDRGAIELFQFMRYPDDFIDGLQDNTNVLEALGISKYGMSVVEFRNRLETTKQHMRLVRADATYYLALCHLMTGNPSVAAIWLARVAEYDTRDFWDAGVRYLRGRCSEMLDEFDKAIGRYQQGKDAENLAPQTHGNLIRARLLKEFAMSTSAETKSTQ